MFRAPSVQSGKLLCQPLTLQLNEGKFFGFATIIFGFFGKKKISTERHTWHVHRAAFADVTTTGQSILTQEMQKITE